jgi:hypothetical protein
MPYEDEYAHYQPLKRVAASQKVQAMLQRVKPGVTGSDSASTEPQWRSDLSLGTWMPDLVLAIDGNPTEVPVNKGFPNQTIGYVTVASVLLDIAKMNRLDVRRPVDPKDFRTIEQAESIDAALPGTNIVLDNEINPNISFRRALFELFNSNHMSESGESLLDTYEALLSSKPTDSQSAGRFQRCPYEDCPNSNEPFHRGSGEYQCPCPQHRSLFSTDALRIHEFMNPEGLNISMFTETMNVLEHVWLIHILRTLEREKLLPVLKKVAIVHDGPLAIFGAPAWLRTCIMKELMRLNQAVRDEINDQSFDLMLFGVEKSGAFMEHLVNLDKGPEGAGNFIKPQSAFLLTDGYIKRRIILSNSDQSYGHNTYFGRKVFYKTSSGALIVINTPFLDRSHEVLDTAEPQQFPRLEDILHLLDKLASARYVNSIMPLISAHAEAAIPLNLGKHVLENLAYELMKNRSATKK